MSYALLGLVPIHLQKELSVGFDLLWVWPCSQHEVNLCSRRKIRDHTPSILNLT
ncbi:hypothetical protein HanIR_Chr12g0563311 [Helianthus annuus]|nr:hypothetical protein HanIR_Chr12g0563311 [Helianthus annuus]